MPSATSSFIRTATTPSRRATAPRLGSNFTRSRDHLMAAKLIQTNTTPFNRIPVDTVTIDIIESALRNARFEMDTVLFRTAMSPGIREQHDEFPMIANADGKMVVGQFGSFIYGFMAGFEGTIEE